MELQGRRSCRNSDKLTKGLTSAEGAWVIVWLLADTDDAVSLALALIVIGGSVEDRAVIPDGNVVLVPLEAHLEIVVAGNQLEEVGLQDVTLAVGDIVDVASSDLSTGGEQALPAGYGICADDRMHGLEVEARVLGRAAIFVDQLESVLLLDIDESGLIMGCRE